MWTFVDVDDNTFLQLVVLVFRGLEECFDFISSSEVHLYASCFYKSFKIFPLIPVSRGPPKGCSCWCCYCWYWWLVGCPWDLKLYWFGGVVQTFVAACWVSEVVKWQACNAAFMLFSSWCNACWSCDTILVLCGKVLYALCLAPIQWLLSQWRYWSVCVLVSCRLWWWVCCWGLVKLECPWMVVILVG